MTPSDEVSEVISDSVYVRSGKLSELSNVVAFIGRTGSDTTDHL